MQSEMKPCPFCGCEKILNGYIRDGREIVCGECRASVVAFHPDASKRAAERWNRRAEAALSAAEPVKTPFEVASKHIPEARVSLLSRAIRQGLNDYGWKNFGTLPEVLMGYIVEAERAEAEAHPKQPPRSVGVKALQELHAAEHAKLGEMLLDKSEDGQSKANWQGGRVNGIGAAMSALSAQVQDVAGEHVAWRLRHKNDGPHMWEYYQLPEAEDSDNLVIQKLTIKQLIDILNDDKHAGAQERPPEPHSPNASVPIDLLQKIWAEMYYGVGGEGGIDDSIAQWNLNEVVDILAMAGALPDVDEPTAPAKQEG